MSSNESRRGRLAAVLLGIIATVAMIAAAPAGAVSGQGSAVVSLAQHAKGRTLSGQGVKVLAEAPATQEGRKLTLPISAVDPGAKPSTAADGKFRFKRGSRSVGLSGLRFDLATGTLDGKLGPREVQVFKLGATPSVNGNAGSVGLSEGTLRLTAEAADLLEEKLGLERALVRRGVGMIWLAARANPTRETKAVASGALDWGFLTSWREYVYKELGPKTVGSITTEGGATTNGNPAQPGSFFAFPASDGSLEQGLYGASSQLALSTQGSVKFAKPGHCIIEIKLSNIAVRLDGAESSLVADLGYDIDKFNGMGCTDMPPVSSPGTTIATLDAGGIEPSYSADGKTATWANIPATLTAAAATPFAPQYKAGQALDPVTITVGLG